MTVINMFLFHYWQCGHFSIASKLKFTLRKMLIAIGIVLGVGLVLMLLVIYYFGK